MSSYVQLVTTKPLMDNLAQSLKIPTVQQKTIIKMMPSQLTSLINQAIRARNQSDQATPVCSMPWRATTVPRLPEWTCGLFNEEIDLDYVDTGTLINKINQDDNFDLLINDFNIQSNTNQSEIKLPKAKSKFSKRLTEANLKLDLNMTKTNNCIKKIKLANLDEIESPLSMNLDDLKLMTPNTETACFQYLQSMPSATVLPSARIITNNQIFESIGINEQDLEKFVSNNLTPQVEKQNPFITETSRDLKLNDVEDRNDKFSQLDTVTLDHGYSTPNKRRISSVFDEGSMLSQDSFGSSFNDNQTSTESARKKHRARGIYRAEDVTNQEEYLNYLERRKRTTFRQKYQEQTKRMFSMEWMPSLTNWRRKTTS